MMLKNTFCICYWIATMGRRRTPHWRTGESNATPAQQRAEQGRDKNASRRYALYNVDRGWVDTMRSKNISAIVLVIVRLFNGMCLNGIKFFIGVKSDPVFDQHKERNVFKPLSKEDCAAALIKINSEYDEQSFETMLEYYKMFRIHDFLEENSSKCFAPMFGLSSQPSARCAHVVIQEILKPPTGLARLHNDAMYFYGEFPREELDRMVAEFEDPNLFVEEPLTKAAR